MATVSFRMDATLKKQTEAILDQLGMNMSTAMTLFAKAVVREHGIPFALTVDPFYSAANQAILEQTISNYESGAAETIRKSLTELEEMTGHE